MSRKKIRKPIVIYFRLENIKDYIEQLKLTDSIFDDWPCKLFFANSFKELGDALKSNPKLIIMKDTMIKHYGSFNEFMLMYDTLICYADISPKPNLAVGICKKTTLDETKEFQRSGIQGIIPEINDYGLEEMERSISTLLNNQVYWPKHIIQTLPGKKTLAMPTSWDDIIGGHAVCVVGYDLSSNEFICRNSFGLDWGEEGYFYMPFDYVYDNVWDSWVFDIELM